MRTLYDEADLLMARNKAYCLTGNAVVRFEFLKRKVLVSFPPGIIPVFIKDNNGT